MTQGKNVIVATSPYISGKIHCYPSLNWQCHQLNQHRPIGTVANILVQDPSKVWKGAGMMFMSPRD
eukprot:11275524-Ditylum_brightwellii.AAC.2